MAESKSGFAVVLTTAGSEEEASRIAEALVTRRLAACVSVVPGVVSHYRWHGQVCRDEERLLLIKTTERLFPEVKDAILELHSYELPELLMLRVGDGEARYLAWLEQALVERDEAGPPAGP
jgi:periplasmic divalent cation tolerance protein